MGVWDRLRERATRAAGDADESVRAPSEAERLEDAGDLAAAEVAYAADGRAAEATRVALVRADAEPDASARLLLLARARRLAAGTPLDRTVRVRYAKARLDLARAAQHGLLRSELSELGRELLTLGEPLASAEAFRLARDADGEAEALTVAGEIETLEEVLDGENARLRAARLRKGRLAEVAALDASGERRRALALARELAAAAPGEPEPSRLAASLEARLLRGRIVQLEVAGERATWVLGASVTLGRAGDAADVVVPAPVVSRRHLSFERGSDGAPVVRDMGSANGTTIAGARITLLRIASPVTLRLGDEIPCRVSPGEDGVCVEVAGTRYHLPLGPARLGPWRLDESDGGLRVRPVGDGRPILDAEVAADGVDLCHGDVLAAVRGQPLVRVIG